MEQLSELTSLKIQALEVFLYDVAAQFARYHALEDVHVRIEITGTPRPGDPISLLRLRPSEGRPDF